MDTSSYAVALKRVDDRTIEWTSKREGKIVGVTKMIVAPDGKKITMIETSETGGSSTVVLEKQ